MSLLPAAEKWRGKVHLARGGIRRRSILAPDGWPYSRAILICPRFPTCLLFCDDHFLNRAPQAEWSGGPVAETHDQLRVFTIEPEP